MTTDDKIGEYVKQLVLSYKQAGLSKAVILMRLKELSFLRNVPLVDMFRIISEIYDNDNGE